jgi:hypothetical protein
MAFEAQLAADRENRIPAGQQLLAKRMSTRPRPPARRCWSARLIHGSL